MSKFTFNPFTSNLDITGSLSDTIKVDTKANILARTGDSVGQLCYATDTVEFYVCTGSNNYVKVPFQLVPEPQSPDMGFTQDSSKIGYRPTYLTNKTLENVNLSPSNFIGTPPVGALRINSGYMQIYLNGIWNNVVMNFVFREDPNYGYTFEHQPIGFNSYIEVMSGNSLTNLGLNGLPIIQQYSVSMGPYPPFVAVGGRNFN